jgi:hypothetical protein
MKPQLDIDRERIAAFCERWRITEFALFGSVLREDFSSDSDVDVLVEFAEDARYGLAELTRMEEELAHILARRVDVVTRRAVEESRNYIRRRSILDSAEVIHAA